MLDEDIPYTDDISSPIAAHLLDFCDDDGGGGDLFSAVNAATSDMFAAASSQDTSSSSVVTPPPRPPPPPAPGSHGGDNNTAAATAAFSPMPSLDSALSALLEDDDEPVVVDDGQLLLPIEYQYAAAAVAVGVEPQTEQQQQQEQFGQLAMACAAAALQTQMSSSASELMHLAATSGYGDDCFAMGGGGGAYNVSLDDAMCQTHGALLHAEAAAVVQGGGGGCFFGKEAGQGQSGFLFSNPGMVMSSMMGMDEIGEYQRMMEGIATTNSPDAESVAAAMPPLLGANAGEMQMSSPGRVVPATSTETSSLEDPNFKSARVTGEERREKIHRYIKKRNKRNFSKTIKYDCRKRLADNRPRIRGRFAKNDEYGEPSGAIQSHHEQYDQMAGIKGEDMLAPNDVLQAHLSEKICSYMYGHTVEWNPGYTNRTGQTLPFDFS